MLDAEQLIVARRAAACILRISLPMGISFNGHAGAIDWIQSRFANRRPATLYFDEVRTPTYTDCLNLTFHAVLASRLHGLYHAGGPQRLSLYEIAQIVNRVGGYDPRYLIGCPRFDAGPIPPRAGDVTMNSDKLAQRWVTTHLLPGRWSRVGFRHIVIGIVNARLTSAEIPRCLPTCCTATRGSPICPPPPQGSDIACRTMWHVIRKK